MEECFNEMEKFERENQFFIKAVWVAMLNLVPRVSHLTAPWSERGGKMREPGNEVGPCWEERLEIRVEQIISVLTLHPSSNNWPEEIVKFQEVANLEECEDPEY